MIRHNGIEVEIESDPIAMAFLRPVPDKDPANLIAQYELLQEAGRALWAELHQEQNATSDWFASWLARIPKFGCTCYEDFLGILERIPPRYGEDWFAWTVEVHNAVNDKLSNQGSYHPQWTLAQAYVRWR